MKKHYGCQKYVLRFLFACKPCLECVHLTIKCTFSSNPHLGEILMYTVSYVLSECKQTGEKKIDVCIRACSVNTVYCVMLTALIRKH